MKKIKIDSIISGFLLAVQAGLGCYALVTQRGGMHGDTDGISLGMFVAIIIFNATNTVLSTISWLNKKTFSTFSKIIPYLVVSFAYILFIYDCIHSRLLEHKSWWHYDDIATILFLLFGYGLYIYIESQKGNSIKNIFFNPINWGYFSGFTIGIAHLMFGFHMIIANSNAGIATELIVFTLSVGTIRFTQNAVDVVLNGSDSSKRALIGSELSNIVTWIIVGIIFFILKFVST